MKANDNLKAVTNTACHRSIFDWGSNMQVVRKGNGDITMTEGELAKFFGVTWSKLNHRLQALMRFSNLHPDERSAGEDDIYVNEQLKGYAPLYPLPIHHCPVFSVWTAQKRICSGSISVRGCRNLHP